MWRLVELINCLSKFSWKWKADRREWGLTLVCAFCVARAWALMNSPQLYVMAHKHGSHFPILEQRQSNDAVPFLDGKRYIWYCLDSVQAIHGSSVCDDMEILCPVWVCQSIQDNATKQRGIPRKPDAVPVLLFSFELCLMIHQVCVIIHTMAIYFPQSINSLPWRGMAVGFALRTRAICRLSFLCSSLSPMRSGVCTRFLLSSQADRITPLGFSKGDPLTWWHMVKHNTAGYAEKQDSMRLPPWTEGNCT